MKVKFIQNITANIKVKEKDELVSFKMDDVADLDDKVAKAWINSKICEKYNGR